jgi:hypothetical protein
MMMLSARSILFLACASALGQNLPPEAWKDDLDFLVRELPARHKNLYYRLRKDDFAAQAAKIAAELPHMSEPEIRVALVRLVSSVGNGHTSITALRGTPWYPIEFSQFPDGYYVVRAATEYREAIGARLVSIGGVPAAELRTRLLPLIPRETPLMERVHLPGLLRLVYALGPGSDTQRFEKNGRQFDLMLEAVAGNARPRLESAAFPIPLYLSDRGSAYWFRYFEAEKVLYFQYNRCEDVKTRPFAEFAKEMMAAADGHPVEKMVIDLRHNAGGNSEVMNPLLDALKARPRLTGRGHFFVLTSRETFSSAFIEEVRLKKLFHAQTVGEASAQRPNSYGDVRTFRLPNSKLEVRYCTQFFRLAHGDPDSLPPDIPVELTAGEYFAGRDPVMDRVLGR